jgi:DNA-binding NarL/FixJ family response regulator
MIENGALGYLLKNASKEDLLDAIHTANKGQPYFSREVQETLKAGQDVTLPILTRREKEVLELIVDGMTNNEIAEKLFISVTTVNSHRKNLLTKLKAKNTAALVRIATQSRF